MFTVSVSPTRWRTININNPLLIGHQRSLMLVVRRQSIKCCVILLRTDSVSASQIIIIIRQVNAEYKVPVEVIFKWSLVGLVRHL